MTKIADAWQDYVSGNTSKDMHLGSLGAWLRTAYQVRRDERDEADRVYKTQSQWALSKLVDRLAPIYTSIDLASLSAYMKDRSGSYSVNNMLRSLQDLIKDPPPLYTTTSDPDPYSESSFSENELRVINSIINDFYVFDALLLPLDQVPRILSDPDRVVRTLGAWRLEHRV